MIRQFDGPSMNISDLWRILGRPVQDGGYIAGTIIKPKLGLRPEPFAQAAYQFWLGGDFIKNDEPQGNQVFAPIKKTIPLVYDAMKRAMDETGEAKLFSMNITADDHDEMLARADFALETFGPDANKLAFLVDGYVGGPGMVTTARRNYPNQFLHYHRAGHGAITSPSAKRGYTAFVLAKMARLQGASAIHVGTMGYGKMEGGADDRGIAYMIERDEAQGPVYAQQWYGMKATTPIISGGMNALRLPGFFANLGHGNVINTAGGGSYGHLDGPGCRGAVAAPGVRELGRGGRPGRVRGDPPRAGPGVRVLPGRRRRALPGLARAARGDGLEIPRPPPPGQPPPGQAGGGREDAQQEHGERADDLRGATDRCGRRGEVVDPGAEQGRAGDDEHEPRDHEDHGCRPPPPPGHDRHATGQVTVARAPSRAMCSPESSTARSSRTARSRSACVRYGAATPSRITSGVRKSPITPRAASACTTP